jgi:hypothetical protein
VLVSLQMILRSQLTLEHWRRSLHKQTKFLICTMTALRCASESLLVSKSWRSIVVGTLAAVTMEIALDPGWNVREKNLVYELTNSKA